MQLINQKRKQFGETKFNIAIVAIISLFIGLQGIKKV